ncbi:hypothetical protein SDC9_156335 [bioreactor metagenome]|uniref:Uncharacterized protein n=1 Tax=bioreactor metagenome TaxID=1076179 RepID=A0A645F4E8_9ZZZZ
MADCIATKEGHGQQAKHNGKLGEDGPRKGLNGGVIDHFSVGQAAVNGAILADAVEHYNGIMHREADDGQHSR